MNVVLDPNTLLGYLENGPITLTVVLGSSTANSETLKMLEGLHGSIASSVNVCLGIAGSVSKSL